MDWTEGPLLKVHVWELSHSKKEWVLCLLGHPAILDSNSLHQLATELHDLLSATQAPVGKALPFPMMPSLDRMIPEEPFSVETPLRLAKYAAEQWMSQFLMRPKLPFQNLTKTGAPLPDSETFLFRRRFSSDQMNALEKAAREHGLHVLSALWASFVLASYRMNHVHLSSVVCQLMAPVSVRGFLEPPVPKHILGCYSSVVTVAERVGATTDFWTFAHHIKNRFDRAVLEGDPLSFVTFSPQVAELFSRRSERGLFSLQLQDAEKWPEESKQGPLSLVDSFESQAAGSFGNHLCLGLSHQWQGSSLTLTAHTKVMDRTHAHALLELVCDILSANCGVELKVQRKGATAEPKQPEEVFGQDVDVDAEADADGNVDRKVDREAGVSAGTQKTASRKPRKETGRPKEA